MIPDVSDTERHVQFTRHFAEAEGAMKAFAYSLVPNRADAEDVIQETLKSLWEHFDDYDPTRPFLPWANRFVYRQVQPSLSNAGDCKSPLLDITSLQQPTASSTRYCR